MTATLDIVIANERGIAVPYNIEESVSNPLDCISHQLGYSTSTSNETKIPKAMVAKPKTACVISSVIHKGLKRPAERILAVPDAIHYMGNLEVSVVIIYKHAARGEYPVNMSMDMRFIKSSDQIMPYVHNRDPGTIFCTLEILSAAKTKGFGDFSAMLTQHWISGYKEHIPGIVPYLREQAGPQLNQFESIRQKYDPQDMFLNKIFARVLGHKE